MLAQRRLAAAILRCTGLTQIAPPAKSSTATHFGHSWDSSGTQRYIDVDVAQAVRNEAIGMKAVFEAQAEKFILANNSQPDINSAYKRMSSPGR